MEGQRRDNEGTLKKQRMNNGGTTKTRRRDVGEKRQKDTETTVVDNEWSLEGQGRSNEGTKKAQRRGNEGMATDDGGTSTGPQKGRQRYDGWVRTTKGQ